MPTIKERIKTERVFDLGHSNLMSIITLDDEYLTTIYTPFGVDMSIKATVAESNFVKKLMEDWPCQDQTLITEQKYRKTIISSCGNLMVKESL